MATRKKKPMRRRAAKPAVGGGVEGQPTPPPLSPQKRQRLLAAFAAGKTRAQIAAELRLDRGQVHQAVKTAEASGTLPAARKRMAAVLEATLEDAFLAKARRPDRLTGYEIGVLFDKWNLLEGQATAVLEVRRAPDADMDTLQALRDLAAGTLPLAPRQIATSPLGQTAPLDCNSNELPVGEQPGGLVAHST